MTLRAASFPLLALLLLAAGSAFARSSDRNQPMTVDSDRNDCVLTDDGQCKFSGNVVIGQGTLDIRASTATAHRRNGEINRIVLTGSPVTLKQQMEDGTPMTANAKQIDYDLVNETLTLIGDFHITSPSGSNTGQKLIYNLRTGAIQGGGDGSRVRTVIQPRNAQGK